MSAREKPELIPWLDYLMYADPVLPYLELFKILARAAYYALGGDGIDAALDQARITVDEWVAMRHKAASQGQPADAKADGPKPVGNREAASARIALAKQGEAKRRLFERGCETVARLFFDVFKRNIFDRREPSEREADAPPPPPVDPAIVEAIRARAAGFMVMPSPRERHLARNDFEPFDELRQAELTAQAMRERELAVQMRQMGSTAPAGHEVGPGHAVTPESLWGGEAELPATAAAQTEPTELQITAFSLALAECDLSAMDAMPEESLGQLKDLQKWFAGYDTSKAPRAAVAAFVRRKFNQVFEPGLLREAAKRTVVRLTAPVM